MVAITLPFIIQRETSSIMLMDQEESEAVPEYEYMGLMGYLTNHYQTETVYADLKFNRHSDYYNLQIESMHTQPETPPPNVS